MKTLLCLALVVVSMTTIASAIFTVPCPMGCADSSCMMTIGCKRCQRGWCLYFNTGAVQSMPICVLNCGEGKLCYSTADLTFCTACGVDNCSRCSERYKCEECKRGYELRTSSYRDSCVMKLYG